MSYRVDPQSYRGPKSYPTFNFSYQADNKLVEIEVGQDGDLFIGDVLEAVKDVLTAGGFDYVDEVRAVNYGEKENTIHTSDSEEYSWTEPADGLPDNDLPRVMTEETLRAVDDDTFAVNPVYTD